MTHHRVLGTVLRLAVAGVRTVRCLTPVVVVTMVLLALVGCSESSRPSTKPAAATATALPFRQQRLTTNPAKPRPASDPAQWRLASEPAHLADDLVADQQALREPSSPEAVLLAAARRQQAAYRALGRHPEWDPIARPRIPLALLETYDRNVDARRQLTAMSKGYAQPTLPAWRIDPPPPADAGFVGAIFTSALDSWAAKMILIIATIGQLFCGAAGLTSASRTWYAFSRDRGMPGWAVFRRVNKDRVPFNAVIGVSVASLVIAIPALFGKNNIPFAFFALTGICTVGLYLAYIIPVYLRLRAGDSFEPGPWNLGRRYKLVNILAIIFVVLVVYALNLPYTPTGLPWNDGFDTSVVNYTPLAILLPLIFGVWYLVSAKNRYQGPVRTLEEDEVTAGI